MHVFISLLAAIWIAFAVIWLVAALNTKRYAHANMRSAIVRASLILIIFSLLRNHAVRHFFRGIEHMIWNPVIASIGIALAALGIGFAIWARVQLGRNWGMPMSLKEDAELITSGPYAYVRHPIYGGVLVAMLGSALVSIWWIAPLVLFGAYFVWSAKTEENIMTAQFPQLYADYKKRTKMFIPFVV
jgi:protein-S-isoprenylcysteine O-methyltransferase Ste14